MTDPPTAGLIMAGDGLNTPHLALYYPLKSPSGFYLQFLCPCPIHGEKHPDTQVIRQDDAASAALNCCEAKEAFLPPPHPATASSKDHGTTGN